MFFVLSVVRLGVVEAGYVEVDVGVLVVSGEEVLLRVQEGVLVPTLKKLCLGNYILLRELENPADLRLPEQPSDVDVLPLSGTPDLDEDLGVGVDVLGDAVVLLARVELERPLARLGQALHRGQGQGQAARKGRKAAERHSGEFPGKKGIVVKCASFIASGLVSRIFI